MCAYIYIHEFNMDIPHHGVLIRIILCTYTYHIGERCLYAIHAEFVLGGNNEKMYKNRI